MISDTGQNLRHNIDDPAGLPAIRTTANDGTLTYPMAGATPAATGAGITGAAYTNNDLNASTATTLFDLDTKLDQVVVQSPANAGLLAATGKLGVDHDQQGWVRHLQQHQGRRHRAQPRIRGPDGGRPGRALRGRPAHGGCRPGRPLLEQRQVVDIAIPTSQKKR